MTSARKKLYGYLGLLFLLMGQGIYFLLPGESISLFVGHMILGAGFLAAFALSGGMNLQGLRAGGFAKQRSFAVRVALTVVAFLVLLIALERRELFEFDSTANKVFSFSEETENLLAALPGELVIRAFYLGGVIDDPKVRRFLRGVERRGVSVELVDPEKNLPVLEKFGISQAETLHFQLTMPDGEVRTAKGTRLSSEESFVGVLKKVLRKDSPRILISKGHGEPSVDEKLETGYLFLKEALEGENFEVTAVSLESLDHLDARVFILAAPREPLTERERRMIVDYLSKGGNILLLHDGRTTREIAGLAKLFGVEVGENVIVEPLPGAQGLGVQPRISDFSPASVITRGFNRTLLLTTASSVERIGNADERAVRELAFSSPNSWAESNLELLFSTTPQAARDTGDRNGPVPIAVAVDGGVAGQRLKGRAVIIGDSDFVTNFHIREVANRDFLLNAVNWLVGEEIRSSNRVKTLAMSTERLSAESRDRIFLFGAIILPELFAALGLFLSYRRSL